MSNLVVKDYVREKLSHLSRGDQFGPPRTRESKELDSLFEQVIEAMPFSSRLYPDVYVWILSDLAEDYLGGQRA